MLPLLLLACFQGAPTDGPADTADTAADSAVHTADTAGDSADSADSGGRRCLDFESSWIIEEDHYVIDWSRLTNDLEGNEVEPTAASAGALIVYKLAIQDLEEALCEGTQGPALDYALWENTFGADHVEIDLLIPPGLTALVRIDGEDGTPWMYKLVSSDAEAAPPATIFVEGDDAAWR